MTPEQVEEAARLLSHLEGLDDVAACAKRRAEEIGLSLRISVYDSDEDGGRTFSDVLLPLSMIGFVMPELRGAVTARLTHLGVKLPKEKTNG